MVVVLLAAMLRELCERRMDRAWLSLVEQGEDAALKGVDGAVIT